MGVQWSYRAPALVPEEEEALLRLCGTTPLPLDATEWVHILTFQRPLHKSTPSDFFAVTRRFSDAMEFMVGEDVQNTINAVFLARTFCKHFIDTLGAPALFSQLLAGINPARTPQPELDSVTGTEFVLALLDFAVEAPCTPSLHDLHMEVQSTLLVLLSSQLRGTDPRPVTADDAADSGQDPFLRVLLLHGEAEPPPLWLRAERARSSRTGLSQRHKPPGASLRAGRAVQTLLARATAVATAMLGPSSGNGAASAGSSDAPAPVNSDGNGEDAEDQRRSVSLFHRFGSAAESLIMLPWQLVRLLWPQQEPDSPLPLRSAFLFLLLVHNARAPSERNPYRSALERVVDETYAAAQPEPPGSESAQTDMGTDADTARPSEEPVVLDVDALFEGLPRILRHRNVGWLLFYSLFHGSDHFHAVASARVDLDLLLEPLLEQLYHPHRMSLSQRYVVVTTLLLLSQDRGLVSQWHDRSRPIGYVQWYRERSLRDITLGSLVILMILRLLQHNLAGTHDSFLSDNAFAALSNLAPTVVHLHPFSSQRLVTLLCGLVRKWGKATATRGETQTHGDEESRDDGPRDSAAAPALSEEEREQLQHRLETLSSQIRILLEFFLHSLQPAKADHNVWILYALLQRDVPWDLLRDESELAPLAAPIAALQEKCRVAVESACERGRVAPPEDVVFAAIERVARHHRHGSITGGGGGAQWPLADADARVFVYEEQDCPELFFVPVVWAAAVASTPDLQWRPDGIRLFHPSDANLSPPAARDSAQR